MKLIFPLLLLTMFAVTSFSQTSIRSGLTVNGVALGAKYSDVIRKLGKPTREVTHREIDQCIGSRIRTLYYPGLKFELFNADEKVYTVFSFEVTSASWNVSGAKIGDTAAAVEKRFGKSGRTIEKEPTGSRWYYDMNDDNPGASNFYFKNGKVFKIGSTYEMC